MTERAESRILLADDHQVIRDLVATMLQDVDGFRVDVAADLKGVENAISENGEFDLIMLDYTMPGMDGLKGVEHVLSLNPNGKVILFSGIDNTGQIRSAMKAGVVGLIPKSNPANTIPDIIRLVLGGATYLPSDIMRALNDVPKVTLSSREAEVLEGLREGKTNKEISEAIGISDATVKLHIRTLSQKLEARNRTQAVMIANELGL